MPARSKCNVAKIGMQLPMLVTPSATHWANKLQPPSRAVSILMCTKSIETDGLLGTGCHVLTDKVLRMVIVAYSLTACRHYASCDAALQAAVTRHKGDCADVTKKRAKKEVLRLAADLLTAVEDLAT